MNSKNNKLNRFTTLPVLLDILINKQLVFSDPQHWPDKNDFELLKIYEEYRKNRVKRDVKIFVLCFLMDHETVHHWNAFANGISGCCIEFNRTELEKLFLTKKDNGVRIGKVSYKKLHEEICKRANRIPFQKRWPYRFEKEFRAIWEGSASETFRIKIDVRRVMTKINLRPNMPDSLFETTKGFLEKHFDVRVEPSTLYQNSQWINKFERFRPKVTI